MLFWRGFGYLCFGDNKFWCTGSVRPDAGEGQIIHHRIFLTHTIRNLCSTCKSKRSPNKISESSSYRVIITTSINKPDASQWVPAIRLLLHSTAEQNSPLSVLGRGLFPCRSLLQVRELSVLQQRHSASWDRKSWPITSASLPPNWLSTGPPLSFHGLSYDREVVSPNFLCCQFSVPAVTHSCSKQCRDSQIFTRCLKHAFLKEADELTGEAGTALISEAHRYSG